MRNIDSRCVLEAKIFKLRALIAKTTNDCAGADARSPPRHGSALNTPDHDVGVPADWRLTAGVRAALAR